ncbi:histidine kinase [Litoribacter alkaliphilus]|uniref:Histidine kinase n=1 Tax=Litoribacter ruber TaxID=702568 RepID=A0AAP2CIX4_9BACT|nr:histidine kinase [Litoribacter alkaliphilus]MBS9525586.1 histidine kinase [Litoribacter alkaliphilus]
MAKKFLAALLLLLMAWPILAQQHPVKHFTTLDGLPNNGIRSLYFNSRGVLWIGTENGVSKMRNGDFLNFDESHGLAFNNCWAITEDSQGNMWFGSYGGGISFFDGKRFKVFDVNNGLINNKVRKLAYRDGKIYVGTENGVSIIDEQTQEITNVLNSQLDHDRSYVSSFLFLENRIFYTTYGAGTFEIKERKNGFASQKHNDQQLVYFSKAQDGEIFMADKGQVCSVSEADFLDKKLASQSFGQSVIWDLAKSNTGKQYAAAWGVFNKDGGLFEIRDGQMLDLSANFNIASKTILALAYDKLENVLYVGSNDEGLFKLYLDETIVYKSLSDQKVKAFAEINGQKAVLHEKGLSLSKKLRLHEVGLERFKKFQQDYISQNARLLPKHEDDFFELQFDLPAEDIEFYELHTNRDHYWINSNIGVFELNQNAEILTYVPVHAYHIGFTPGGKLIESNFYGGTRIYDDPGNMVYTYFPNSLPNNPAQIARIQSSTDATYLASVFHGLFYYKDGQFQSLQHSLQWEEAKLKRLHFAKNGQMVIASEFGEVFVAREEPSFHIVEKINKEVIQGNTVLFVESYGDQLIIATEKGLNFYKDGRVRFFDEEQGFTERIFTAAKVVGDELLVGTHKGYYKVALDRLLESKTYTFNLGLHRFDVNHQPYEKGGYKWFVFQQKQLDLDHDENTLTMEFSSHGHPYPGKLRYRYRLKPEGEWSPYQAESKITLPYLPVGDYKVQVEVQDLHSDTNCIHDLLAFTIHPPFYMTWWFNLFAGVWLVLIVYGVYRYRLRKVTQEEKKKAAIETRIAETKLEALRSQMNPHFIYNAMNSIQYYMLTNEVERASEFLQSFSGLIRNTLYFSSQQTIPLKEEIEFLENYISLENMRVENKITFLLNVEERINVRETQIPPLLLQPFIENVFVHAFDRHHPNPELQLTFRLTEEGNLLCVVKDNGQGIPLVQAPKLHESKGTFLVKERMDLMRGKVDTPYYFNSVQGEGTTIQLILPSRFVVEFAVREYVVSAEH